MLGGLLPMDPTAQEHELLCHTIELGLTFDQLQGAELSCFELLEMKLRDKVAGFLFGGSFEKDSHIYLGSGRTGGVRLRFTGKGVNSCQGASKAERSTIRRAARRRLEEMTVPGENAVGVLLAESVQKVERSVSRELLPLPIPLPENEEVESERLRGLSRAMRSRVKRHEARGLARLGQRWGSLSALRTL